MSPRYLRLVQASALGLDLFGLNLIVLTLYWSLSRTHGNDLTGYIRFWMWLNIAWMAVSAVQNLYGEKSLATYERFCRTTARVYIYWLVPVLVYLFFARQFALSRVFISSVLITYGMVLLLNRFLYLGLRHVLRHHQLLARRVMIIGYNDTAKKLVQCFEEQGRHRELAGFCEEAENVRELSHYPIVGPVAQTIEACRRMGVQEVYSTISPEQDRGIYQLMEEADRSCIHFRIIPDLRIYLNRSFHIEYLKDLPLLSTRREPLEDAANRARKRLFDIVVSGLVIILVLPWLVPLVGLLIKLDSRGPVFFRQQRTGRGNQPFWCIKFRSMRCNAEAHVVQAFRGDGRLTRVGRWLRRTNLDEVPQFLNAFAGEMSVVGPRPHMLKHTDDFSKLVDDYMVRQFVKPGITGWAQVNGYRGETTKLSQLQGRVTHDLWYAENWSLWLDLRILFLTVWTTLRGDKNAY